MGKIKLNLVSGAIVEKPLINAFKANNFEYVVLDNEMNGSMGLPIILVCKMLNNRLTKIVDQSEWQIVKEYLKNIIAGNQIEFINIPNVLEADDVYYTQLTLPVPSFDALKNTYKPPVDNEVSDGSLADIFDINPSGSMNADVSSNNINNLGMENVSVSSQINPTPAVSNPIPTPAAPPIDLGMPSSSPVVEPPVVENPENQVNPSSPVIDLQVANPAVENAIPINNVEPSVSPVGPMPTSVNNEVSANVTPVNPNSNNVDIFKDQKEAFMQACENMFDALVQKFEKELENRK